MGQGPWGGRGDSCQEAGGGVPDAFATGGGGGDEGEASGVGVWWQKEEGDVLGFSFLCEVEGGGVC